MTKYSITQFTYTLVAGISIATAAFAPGCGDNQLVVEGEHYQYVVSEILLPNGAAEATNKSLDLDGDGRNDNWLGVVFTTLRGIGFDIQPDVTAAVRNGGILIGLDVQTSSWRDAELIGVQPYLGMSAVPPPCESSDPLSCGQHLMGNASIRVAPANRGNLATGPLHVGEGLVRGDELTLKLAFANDVLIDITLHDAVMRLTEMTAVDGLAIISGVVAQQDVRDVVLPKAAKQFNRIVDRDCALAGPAMQCTCGADSGGAYLVKNLDYNLDCEISDTELGNNGTVRGLLTPDIESSVGPGLSFSVRTKLVRAKLIGSN